MDSKTVFDTSNELPVTISTNDENFVEGFKIGIESMKKGEKAKINIEKKYGFKEENNKVKIPEEYKEKRKELSEQALIYEIELLDIVKRKDLTINDGTFIKTIIKESDKGYIGESDIVKMDLKIELNGKLLFEKTNWIEHLKSKKVSSTVRKLISSMNKYEETKSICKYTFLKEKDPDFLKEYEVKENEQLEMYAKTYNSLSTRSFYKNDSAILCTLKSSNKYNRPNIESTVKFLLKVIVNNKTVFSNFCLKSEIKSDTYELMQIQPEEDIESDKGEPITINLIDYGIPSVLKKAIKNGSEDEVLEIRYSKLDKLTDGLTNEIIKNEWFKENDEVRFFIILKSIVSPESIRKAKLPEKKDRVLKFKSKATEFFKKGNILMSSKIYNKITKMFTNGDMDITDEEKKQDPNFTTGEKELQEIKKTCMTNLVLCKFKLNNLKETIESADAAIKVNPNNAKNYYFKAKALYMTKDFEESMKVIKIARNLDPSNSEIANEETVIGIEYKKFIDKARKQYSKLFAK